VLNGEILIEKGTELKCLEFKDLYFNIFKYLEKELGDLNVKIVIVPSLKDV